MPREIIILTITAASLGFFHTLLGPDHYVPFIMMSRARGWSTAKTAWITFLCGLGHVGSSIVIGIIGISAGISLSLLERIEAVRGDIAAWLLFGFGVLYLSWGIYRALIKKAHTHWHNHHGGITHLHEHIHEETHSHRHREAKSITPWILFTIFVFGPCEPLIPILMVPASQHSIGGLILVTAGFSFVTIATMMGIVMLISLGLSFAVFGKFEKYAHAVAGGLITLSAAAILFLGL